MFFKKNNSVLLQKIDPYLIIKLYKHRLGVDIQNYFMDIDRLEYREHIESGIRYFYPLITGNESFYEQLQDHNWYYQKHKNEYDFVSKYTQNKRVLEIGCGNGNFYNYSNASEYTGLEFNDKAIRECKKKGLTVFKHTISEHKQSHTEMYDVVCSFQVLEHIIDPFLFLHDTLSCLNKSGYLIISVPSEDSFVSLARNNILNVPPHHVTRWPDKSFLFLQRKFNIKLIQIHHEKLDDIHKKWFTGIVGREIINNLLHIKSYVLFDNSVRDKLITLFGNLMGRFLKLGFRNEFLSPVGHTVTAVYKKHENTPS
jgi:2-polyprenyl-3-methyl-5-hydroxy-6-metoxy-1,4-benzoquinol methylase